MGGLVSEDPLKPSIEYRSLLWALRNFAKSRWQIYCLAARPVVR